MDNFQRSSCGHIDGHMSSAMSTKYIIGLAAISVCAVTGAADGLARSRSHLTPRPGWQSSVAVEPDAPSSVETKLNPVCVQLTSNVNRHIGKRKAIVASLAKAATAPPPTVVAAVKGLFGATTANSLLGEQKKKIDGEDATISELNTMLVSLNCTPVAVDDNAVVPLPEDPVSGAVVEDKDRTPDLLVDHPR
jgi:hypothetical protein